MMNPVFIHRVVLNNYKSIKECSVSLGPLTFLVGQNGAGKSNFLDALRLVAESLNTSLEHSSAERGGINEVRRRSSGHPTHFGIRIEWQLPDNTQGFYSFRVGAKERRGFEIQREDCRIYIMPRLIRAAITGLRQESSKNPASRWDRRPPKTACIWWRLPVCLPFGRCTMPCPAWVSMI